MSSALPTLRGWMATTWLTPRRQRRVVPRLRRHVPLVVLAVLLASTGAVGAMALVLHGASLDPPPAAAPSTQASSTAPPLNVAPAVAVEVAVGVRRHRVGSPDDYPGLLASAPLPAIAAYQRAAMIIDSAADCGLRWIVLAAIGRVESNHGRAGAFGAPLDGRGGSGVVPDTDRGTVDNDQRWDAPIGPMRLLPTTWTAVAVDADNDGIRNPQDLDDAALAAAVLLCSHGNLARPGALRAALASYHPAPGFVRTVLVLAARYAEQATPLPPPPAVVPPLPALPVLDPLCECTARHAARQLPSGATTADALTPPPIPAWSPVSTPTPSDDPSPTDPTSPTDEPSLTDGSAPTDEPTPSDEATPTGDPTPTPVGTPTDEPSMSTTPSPTQTSSAPSSQPSVSSSTAIDPAN